MGDTWVDEVSHGCDGGQRSFLLRCSMMARRTSSVIFERFFFVSSSSCFRTSGCSRIWNCFCLWGSGFGFLLAMTFIVNAPSLVGVMAAPNDYTETNQKEDINLANGLTVGIQ